jgi:hypothetical protein
MNSEPCLGQGVHPLRLFGGGVARQVHAVTRHAVPLYTQLWKEKPVKAVQQGWSALSNKLIAGLHRVYTGDDSKGRLAGRDDFSLNRNFNDIVR